MSQSSTERNPSVKIQTGSVIIYRVFDVAEEIDLVAVERILREGRGTRLGLTRGTKSALVMRNAPLRLNLGKCDVKVGEIDFYAETVVTLWDYGALSISFQIPIEPGTEWPKLVELGKVLNSDDSGREGIDERARQRVSDLLQVLKPAFKRPSLWGFFEDYVVYYLESIDGLPSEDAAELVRNANVPSLILGEPTEPISDKYQEGILEHVYQYSSRDLVVIDWNSAVVVEPSGQREITDVLEFALTHLLEVRYYDDLIDNRLAELYDAIEVRRQSLFRSRFSPLLKEANTRYMEFSEFMERVDNSLKVVGDFYLAVVFRAAIRRFRIPDWQQSITRKMNILTQISELLQGEVNVFRGHTLEIIIIALIAYEIVAAIMI